jgi:hypothetical protein
VVGTADTAVARADEDGPAKKDRPDGPPRLKRKKRADTPPAVKEPKTDKDKQPAKAKEKEAEEDGIVPEDGPDGDPEEDDKDVLERIAKNMRSVEEKLGNRELDEPTSQQQRDILKDIDSLIRRKQQQQGGGGGAEQQPQGGADQEQKPGASQKQRRSERRMARGKQRGQGRQQARRQQRQGRGGGRMMARQQPRPGAGQRPQPRPMGGKGGNEPGKGGDSPEKKRDLNADMYKDVWGHLPESLRPEMNAYSNPQPFLPRYDDLVKKYYRTIAEQGRKKGD